MPEKHISDTGWHLDRRVPLALIVTIILQTAGAFWFVGQLAQRVTELETAQMENQKVNLVVYQIGPTIEAMQASLIRIERNQEKLQDRFNKKED